jgi:hypothetical protein
MIRLARPDDAANVAEWSVNTPSNNFDPSTAAYENLLTLAIEDGDGPVLYIPCHPALVIESAACRPGITPRQYIEGLLQAKAETERLARQFGMREIYTSSSYEPMRKTLQRHGYSRVDGALRKKI